MERKESGAMRAWTLWAVASAISYGAMSVAMKQAGARLGWKLATVIGMGVEAVLVGGVALWLWLAQPQVQTSTPRPAAGAWAWAVLIGVSALGGFVGFIRGCESGPVSVVQGLVSSGTLVVVVLVGAALLAERLSVLQWIGVALGVASILFLTFGDRSGK